MQRQREVVIWPTQIISRQCLVILLFNLDNGGHFSYPQLARLVAKNTLFISLADYTERVFERAFETGVLSIQACLARHTRLYHINVRSWNCPIILWKNWQLTYFLTGRDQASPERLLAVCLSSHYHGSIEKSVGKVFVTGDWKSKTINNFCENLECIVQYNSYK